MKYEVGAVAEFSKTISEHDVYQFAGITGDFNSVHINKVAAEESIFKNRICHGMLVGSFVSTVLGMYLPGPGTIYLGQYLKFLKPVFIGETITAKVEIIEYLKDDIIKLNTVVVNQDNVEVITGEAIVKLPAEL